MLQRALPQGSSSPTQELTLNARRIASVAAASTLLLLASCAGGSADASNAGNDTDSSAAPVEGGRLVFATNVEPNCLDVGASPADITAVVGRNLFDTLLAQAPDGSSTRRWRPATRSTPR